MVEAINKLAFIKEISIFSDTSEIVLKEIASQCELMLVASSETIFRKGDEPDGVYFIYSGEVKIHDGDYVFATFQPLDFFGEYSLIDSDVRSASVTAVSDTVLLKLEHQNLHRFLYSNEKITKGLLISLIKRLRENNELEEKLAARNQKIQNQAKKLKAQQDELKELNAMKDKFIAVMAHDLRNPLSTILGLVDILEENIKSVPEEKIIGYLKQVKNYSLSTLELLSDLLQWAKSQSGLLNIFTSNIDLTKVIRENIRLFEPQAKARNISIDYKAGPPLYVDANGNMISTVLRNLLLNAVKFTPEGGSVKVSVKSLKNSLKITVADTGPGINKADQQKLFKIEEDVSKIGAASKQTLPYKGSGLGLILCKEFISRHKGKIWIESDVAKGCKVHFTLPLQK